MNRRLLRAIASITLGVTVMGLVAYGFSSVSRTGWVWWLAPLTVALEGSLLFRPGARASAVALVPSELPVIGDLGVSTYFVTSALAVGVAAWGAYTGNRVALIIGAGCAILGTAIERSQEPTLEWTTGQHEYSSQPASPIFTGAIAFHRRHLPHDSKLPAPSGQIAGG